MARLFTSRSINCIKKKTQILKLQSKTDIYQTYSEYELNSPKINNKH